ncbi:unnamed protein product [Lathyrus sativus]|nr:unnamed protein product [Lathyrus sativus]
MAAATPTQNHSRIISFLQPSPYKTLINAITIRNPPSSMPSPHHHFHLRLRNLRPPLSSTQSLHRRRLFNLNLMQNCTEILMILLLNTQIDGNKIRINVSEFTESSRFIYGRSNKGITFGFISSTATKR